VVSLLLPDATTLEREMPGEIDDSTRWHIGDLNCSDDPGGECAWQDVDRRVDLDPALVRAPQP